MMQEFTQSMKDLMHDTVNEVHTAMPGKIVSFDPDKCEAQVLPTAKFKKPDGDVMDFPKISGVPVLFPQGAGQAAIIAWPVKPGDECLLIVSEQALDTWRTGAESSTELRFDLTNSVAIIGLFSKAHSAVRKAQSSNALVIEAPNIIMTASGSITMTAGTININ